ncbi:uncharacterized protein SPAPADRAFT_72242, partial [Spathaspora passalidarum NRRL Y-27907]
LKYQQTYRLFISVDFRLKTYVISTQAFLLTHNGSLPNFITKAKHSLVHLNARYTFTVVITKCSINCCYC